MPEARLALSPDASAPSKARELLGEVLDGHCSSEQLSKAQLALSEVVNNAVQHGPAENQDRIELEIVHVDGLVTVRVIQLGPVPERPSIVNMPEAWSTGGYGLAIIDSIADRWGVQVQPPSVWFDIRCGEASASLEAGSSGRE
jgi:anti-sigma regulatory factor (Ser/Thr protein kinase)